jgi:OmcA/MtrC family decaheme c-type cytochrome
MRRSHFKFKKHRYALFFTVMILGALLLIGCGGSGDTGASGPPGPTGPTGPTTPVTTTGETCNVCHGAGKIADIAVAHPDPTGKDVTLSNMTLTNTGGNAVVSFHAATASGPVTDLILDDFIFMIADLVPANTPTATWGTWDTPYFERWAYERTGVDTRNNNTPYPHGTFDATDAANGNYTYSFVTGFGSADAIAAAPEYNAADTQRLAIIVSGHNDANGNAVTNNTVGFLDFVVPAGGASAVPLDSQRQFVTADACKKCHSPLFQQAHHADMYLDTRTCDICHSPIGTYGTIMQTNHAYLPVLIHQIHDAVANPAFSTSIRGLGFDSVTYPQSFTKTGGTAEIPDCVSCHSNPNNLNLGTGDEIDHWKTHPTAEVCGSCHVTLNFTTGDNHPGGPQTNDVCYVCHPASGTGFGMSVATAHDTTPTDFNVPEFDVTLSITPPANGTYYVADEAPEIHVTLTNHSDGSAVDPSIYTTPQDAAGHSGGGLNVASLYVYGPRAKSVPVLATGTVTDPKFDSATDTPTQEHLLFANGTDPQVTTDITGFNYQLLPIPAGMTAGTYMVRVRINDYGRVGTGNYHIDSTAFTNIQIGTATVEDKVAGNACIDCHGTRTAPFHDERHAVVFDTDQCLACHDQSGNFATPIANRVHAVHSANSAGDIFNITGGTLDWSDITYPQNIQSTVTGHAVDDGNPRCVGCHTSGDVTYKTLPYMMPCVGCHTDAVNPINNMTDIDHMRQNGGPF